MRPGCISVREETWKWLASLFITFCPLCPAALAGQAVSVFDRVDIHFDPEGSRAQGQSPIRSEDNGRVVARTVDLPEHEGPLRVFAVVATHPIPKDEREVHDRWDRAGHVRLAFEDQPDVEVLKFMTAYGGFTEHRVDVTHLAPILRGPCTFKAFIDTWVIPAWQLDFSIEYEAVDTAELYGPQPQPLWVKPVCFIPSYDTRTCGPEGVEAHLAIPGGGDRVLLHYLVSGHCTDGRGADEFKRKDNVIYVDDRVVYRFRPWRDDCRQFREVNPYCARWSDGYWSSDYSRSGWCPGDEVLPVEIDLTDHLPPGEHTIRIVVENPRPLDDAGNYGYWRISAHLTGWTWPS